MENKIKSKLYFFYKKYLSYYFRLSSYPYISGDTLRNYCDHVWDETSTIDPTKVMHQDKVFVKGDMLFEYFNKIGSLISNNYSLFTHNSDEIIDDKYRNLIDDNIIHWFAQNLTTDLGGRVSIIPIGLENRWYLKNGKLHSINKVQKQMNIKDLDILAAFNTQTNSERLLVKEISDKNQLITQIDNLRKKYYLDYISRSKFNICPEGNGPDTHRIWESLILRSIPILKSSAFSKNLKNQGIPIYILKNWQELESISIDELNHIYEKYSKIELTKFSQFSYWESIINQHLGE